MRSYLLISSAPVALFILFHVIFVILSLTIALLLFHVGTIKDTSGTPSSSNLFRRRWAIWRLYQKGKNRHGAWDICHGAGNYVEGY